MGLPVPPAQMIHEIAAGMEEPVEIAYRYGYTASEWERLEAHGPFRQAVASARAELEKGGHAVRVKARWMTEVLMEDLFFKSKQHGVSIGQLQESIRVLSRLGDLEPKPNAPTGPAAPTFTVTINVPTLPAPEKTIIDMTEQLAFPVFDAQPVEPSNEP